MNEELSRKRFPKEVCDEPVLRKSYGQLFRAGNEVTQVTVGAQKCRIYWLGLSREFVVLEGL